MHKDKPTLIPGSYINHIYREKNIAIERNAWQIHFGVFYSFSSQVWNLVTEELKLGGVMQYVDSLVTFGDTYFSYAHKLRRRFVECVVFKVPTVATSNSAKGREDRRSSFTRSTFICWSKWFQGQRKHQTEGIFVNPNGNLNIWINILFPTTKKVRLRDTTCTWADLSLPRGSGQ